VVAVYPIDAPGERLPPDDPAARDGLLSLATVRVESP